jgi:hypothetical protein
MLETTNTHVTPDNQVVDTRKVYLKLTVHFDAANITTSSNDLMKPTSRLNPHP